MDIETINKRKNRTTPYLFQSMSHENIVEIKNYKGSRNLCLKRIEHGKTSKDKQKHTIG